VRMHRIATETFTQAVDQAVEAGLQVATAMLGGNKKP
jgi:hypothetical protein